jgi:hypothetical protein
MARRPREKKPLPPPLPPETRTVGQLVAETVRFYGTHFWRSLALGLGPAAITVAAYEVGWRPVLLVVAAGWVVLATASFVGAAALAAGGAATREGLVNGLAVGIFIALPGLVLAPIWYPLFGLAVPAAVFERRRPIDAFRRGIVLGRTDYAHAFGSIWALGIVVFLTQGLLFSLLHGASQQAITISAFLAALVVQPILFLGGALLYFDQSARAVSSAPRPKRRRDADVSHAHNPH